MSMRASFWGLDVGGANLKIADATGQACCQPFELWKHHQQLCNVLTELMHQLDGPRPVALTMTGELADCYPTKAEGVEHIINAVVQAVDPLPVVIWQTPGEFVTADVATEFPILTAASNWHVLATWVGRSAPVGSSLLIDCGTTTTDIIPLQDGLPVSAGLTDLTRLQSHELVYIGSRRTPLCALGHIDELPAPMAAEWFATLEDCRVITGDCQPQPDNCATADGRPLTLSGSLQRLARQFCCDIAEMGEEQLHHAATVLIDSAVHRLSQSVQKVISAQRHPPQLIVTSGSGESLLDQVLKRAGLAETPRLSISQLCSPQAAECACAMACAILAEERIVLAPTA